MRVLGITLPEDVQRHRAAAEHFAERRVPVEWIAGINAEAFGLRHTHPYPNDGDPAYLMPNRQVGCMLSHYMAWTALQVSGDEYALICEDDADFPDDWYMRTVRAMVETPPDVDMLYVGSCNCSDKPQVNVGDGVFKVDFPFCTHAVIVWRKALPVLLSTQRDVWAPVDISLGLRSHPKLNVYAVLPRLIGQRGTELFP